MHPAGVVAPTNASAEGPPQYRPWERATYIGAGDEFWHWATIEALRWGVKTRSGFTVDPDHRVSLGGHPVICAHPLGLSTREPVEVVDVLETDTQVGFAYRTFPEHPVSGEEAFIIAPRNCTLIGGLTRHLSHAIPAHERLFR